MATKECIACAEQIQESAKLCKHCGTMQNDRRFSDVVTPIPQPYLQQQPQNATSTVVSVSQRLCTECEKYVVGDYYDRCEVCRGISDVGTLPEDVNAAAASSGESGTHPSYLHVPLGPTPGIAVAAIVLAFFVPILGLILGYSARTEVRNPNNPKEGDGLATGAIIIGWIWIFALIIWIMMVIATAATYSTSWN